MSENDQLKTQDSLPLIIESISLLSPASSPGNDSTPTIRISGVTTGHTVKLFTDATCSSEVASGVATEAAIDLTASTLTAGQYSFYARSANAAGLGPCSLVSVSYSLSFPSSFPIPKISSGLKKSTSKIHDLKLTPNESKVVFRINSVNDSRIELWAANVDGTGLVLLSRLLQGKVTDFEITPDSQKVVFIGTATNSIYYNLYSVNLDGTGFTRINQSFSKGTMYAGGWIEGVFSFKISPDGTKIMYQFRNNDDEAFVASVNVDGTSHNFPVTEQMESAAVNEFILSNSKIYYLEDSNLMSANWDWTSKVYVTSDTNIAYASTPIPFSKSPTTFILKSNYSAGFLIGASSFTIGSFNPTSSGLSTVRTMTNFGGLNFGSVQRIGYNFDESKVLYIADESVFLRHELYSMNPNGTGHIGLSLNTTGRVSWFAANPANGKVAFVSDQSTPGTKELFIVNGDGTGLLKLNAPLASGGQVEPYLTQFTPDGTAIMYAAHQEATGRLDYYRVNVDGTNRVRLNHDFSGTGSIKSPPRIFSSGSKMLYAADDDGDGSENIFIRTLASGATVKILPEITMGSDILVNMLESPDGQKLLIHGAVSTHSDAFTTDLQVFNRVTGQMTRFATSVGLFESKATFGFSADSQKIYYTSRILLYTRPDLYVANADGSNPQMISDGLSGAHTVTYMNNKLYYHRYGIAPFKIVAVNLDGTGATDISNPGDVVAEMKISPNGQKIVYKAGQDIFSINLDGTQYTKLNGTMVGTTLSSYAFRADSQKVIYAANQDVATSSELYSVNLDGTSRTKLHPNFAAGRNITAYTFNNNKVSYIANQSTAGLRELYVSNWDGTGNVKISGPFVGGAAGADTCNFSSDGQYVIFSGDKAAGGKLELFSGKIDGTAAVKLNPTFTSPSNLEFNLVKTFSKVIMYGDFEQIYRYKLYSINPDGTGITDLVGALTGLSTVYSDFSVLESQQKIIFRMNKDDVFMTDLYVVNFDGSGLVKLNTGLASGSVMKYKLTADNSTLVFQVRDAAIAKTNLFKVTINPAISSPVALAPEMPSTSGFFSWILLGLDRLLFIGNGESANQVDLYEDSL